MSIDSRAGLLVVAAALGSFAAGCGGPNESPPNNGGGGIGGTGGGGGAGASTGKLGFSTTDPAIGAFGINDVKLTVTAADILTPLTATGTVAGTRPAASSTTCRPGTTGRST